MPQIGIPTPFRPDFGNPAADTTQIFVKGNARAAVFVGYYRDQTQGRELISQQSQLITTTDKQWLRVGTGIADVFPGTQPLLGHGGLPRGIDPCAEEYFALDRLAA